MTGARAGTTKTRIGSRRPATAGLTAASAKGGVRSDA